MVRVCVCVYAYILYINSFARAVLLVHVDDHSVYVCVAANRGRRLIRRQDRYRVRPRAELQGRLRFLMARSYLRTRAALTIFVAAPHVRTYKVRA